MQTGAAAMLGLSAGFIVWCYTLLLPTVAPENAASLRDGFLGFTALRPEALFEHQCPAAYQRRGMEHCRQHPVLYSGLALARIHTAGTHPGQHFPAAHFHRRADAGKRFRTTVTVAELKATMARYLGAERVERASCASRAANSAASTPA